MNNEAFQSTRGLPAIPPGVRLHTLSHGLTVIVCEDHSAPVASVQAWCKAGSIHEGNLLGAGMSHALEHMLFKGTKKRQGARIDQEVQEAGGCMNAYTSFDRTVYWIDVPNTGARTAIDILCDIMQNATLPAEELEKEKDVILREMDMNEDDPGRRSSRSLFEIAYTRSPYRFTVIGYPDIFKSLSREDLLDYYHRHYTPNNVFYVVVGDVDGDEVVKQIEEAYANGRTTPLPPMFLPDEPRQTAPREQIEEAPIELGHFHISWHIPDVRDPDVPLLDALSTLLGNGRSSRLFQEVRQKQGVVHSVDAWTYSPGNPGLFGMSAVADGDKFEAARDAMFAELERMKHEPVSHDELGKVVKQFTSATLSTRKTMSGRAQDLGGNWLAAQDLNFSERYLEAVRRATPEDLLRVARTYLTDENRTLFALLPTGCTPKPETAIAASETGPIRKFELPNGLRLLVKEDRRLPFTQIRVVLNGGVLAETPENSGITHLMGRMLMQGTGKRSAEQIATEIESIGGSLSTYGGNNSFGLSAEVLGEDLATGLDMVTDVLLNPAFPADALERERQFQLAAIRAHRDQLLQSCMRSMRRTLFGPQGYGLDGLGDAESVGSLGVDDLRAFHRKSVAPNQCVIAVFGDVDAEHVRAEIERHFAGWKRVEAPLESPVEPRMFAEVQRLNEVRDKKQAVIVVGFPGTRFQDEDRYALDLVQEACSDLGSRLFLRIRDELGLAYYVGAQHMPGKVPGYFAFYVGTSPEQAALAEKELLDQARLLATEGITREELDRARAKVIGQKKIGRQDLGSLAMACALDELYGHGFDFHETEDRHYDAVTPDQIIAAAAKHLSVDTCIITQFGGSPEKRDGAK